MKIAKTGMYFTGALATATGMGAIMPATAFATWDPDDIVESNTEVDPTEFNAQTLSQWVTTITTWLAGLAIVFFVLRLVITGIDRAIWGKDDEDSEGPLKKLPKMIAPYEGKVGTILKKFGIGIAIVAGAWILVNLVSGIILAIFGAVSK